MFSQPLEQHQLSRNPWSIPDQRTELTRIAITLAGATLAGTLAIGFRHNDPSVAIGLRAAAALFGLGASAYALVDLLNEDELEPLRDANAHLRTEVGRSILEAKAEYYLLNPAAFQSGLEVPPDWVTAWFRREYGLSPEVEPTPEPAAAQKTTLINDPEPAPLRWFDWDELQNGTAHPHLLIFGGSGDGKTTLIEWLGRELAGDGELQIWTTKRKGDQWYGLKPIGIPRDFAKIEAAYQDAIATLTQRCSNLDAVNSDLVIVWDEISAAVAELPHLSPASILREGREARIRLIAAPHGGQVGSLGLKGDSDVLHCATPIRLGDFAIDHARKLWKRGDLTEAEFDEIASSDRPCMVKDHPAQIPYLSTGWQRGSITVGARSSDSPEAIIAQLLTDHPAGLSVRDLQRTSIARSHGLRADAIRSAVMSMPEVEAIEVEGKKIYRLVHLSHAETLVPAS
jgi:hypothetical protein